METLIAGATQPPRTPSRRASVPGWLPEGTLALGGVLATLALFLPWERVTQFNSGVPGNYETANIPVSTTLFPNPSYSVAELLFAPGFHSSLAQDFAGVVWRAAVPLIGVALLLAFFSWHMRWLRLPLLAAFTLWSALLGVIGVNFLVILRYISTVSYSELVSHPSQRNWWTQLTSVSGIYGSQTAGPAWGWYVLWAGLALALVGIAWCALRTWRPVASEVEDVGGSASVQRTPLRISTRRQRIAVVLCTLSFLVWAAALLALPLALVTCPTPTTGAGRRGTCLPGSPLYALEVEAIAPLFTIVPSANSLAAAETESLVYLRTIILLALALVAAPFALLAVWRAHSTWLRAVAGAAWGALVLVVTWTAVFSALAFIRPQHTPGSSFFVSTPFDPAVGVVLVPLAALALLVGLALRWLPIPREGTPTSS